MAGLLGTAIRNKGVLFLRGAQYPSATKTRLVSQYLRASKYNANLEATTFESVCIGLPACAMRRGVLLGVAFDRKDVVCTCAAEKIAYNFQLRSISAVRVGPRNLSIFDDGCIHAQIV